MESKRPVLVELKSLQTKLEILKNLHKLKGETPNISVANDMSHKQRQKYNSQRRGQGARKYLVGWEVQGSRPPREIKNKEVRVDMDHTRHAAI